jgi:hypothetical protein
MKKSIILSLLLFCCYFYAAAQYTANFSVPGRGLVLPQVRASDCKAIDNNHDPANCFNYNVSGMNWTLTGTTFDPFWMSYNPSHIEERSYAHTIAGGKFETMRTQGDVCVTSPVINIASAGNVTINLAVFRSGTHTYSDFNDDVEFKYILDGNLVTSGSLTGGAGSTSSKSWTVSGNSLQVFACMAQNQVTENYQLTTFNVSGGSAMPIELNGFFAKINSDNHIVLDWQTAMENKNAYFDIERSTDGQTFKNINQVKSLGNTTKGYTYQYTDVEPLEGIAYYRLKQVDEDDNYTYSPIVSVNRNKYKNTVRLLSNPVAHTLEIGLLKSNNKILNLTITDLTGRVIMQETRLQNGEMRLSIPTNNLSVGIYLLNIVGNDVRETLKFVKI